MSVTYRKKKMDVFNKTLYHEDIQCEIIRELPNDKVRILILSTKKETTVLKKSILNYQNTTHRKIDYKSLQYKD